VSEQKSADDQLLDRAAANIAANREVANRIRDVAKWLILVFGAIGGVLLTGLQLSSIGEEGTDHTLAIAGLVLGLFGAALALGFTVVVLLPTRISLKGLAEQKKDSGIPKLVAEDDGLLDGYAKTIAGFVEVRNAAIAAVAEARKDLETNSRSDSVERLEKDLKAAEAKRGRIGATSGELLSLALTERVKNRMVIATVAVFAGAFCVAGGISLFSWATNQSGTSPVGEVVPKRPSGALVRLSRNGRETLAGNLGRNCGTSRLKAIALGGPPNALEMVSVPVGHCETVRFVLTPTVGSIRNQRPLRTTAVTTSGR
jgi:hypothetical protein